MSQEGRDYKWKRQLYKGQESGCVCWQEGQKMKLTVWIEIWIYHDNVKIRVDDKLQKRRVNVCSF